MKALREQKEQWIEWIKQHKSTALLIAFLGLILFSLVIYRFSTWFIAIGSSISLIVNALLFVPQIIKIIKTKSAEGVSLITFAGFNVIQLFITLHGLVKKDYMLALGFGLSLITCGIVTGLIVYYQHIKRDN